MESVLRFPEQLAYCKLEAGGVVEGGGCVWLPGLGEVL